MVYGNRPHRGDRLKDSVPRKSPTTRTEFRFFGSNPDRDPDRAGAWYAKTFAAVMVAYALSPIDFIPDAIPGLWVR